MLEERKEDAYHGEIVLYKDISIPHGNRLEFSINLFISPFVYWKQWRVEGSVSDMYCK